MGKGISADAEVVVWSINEVLPGAEIGLGSFDRGVAEQKLDLLEITASLAA